jgi:hypothetical protein
MDSLRVMAESQGDVAWAVAEIERLHDQSREQQLRLLKFQAENERLREIEAVAKALCEELPGVKWLRQLRAALDAPPEQEKP